MLYSCNPRLVAQLGIDRLFVGGLVKAERIARHEHRVLRGRHAEIEDAGLVGGERDGAQPRHQRRNYLQVGRRVVGHQIRRRSLRDRDLRFDAGALEFRLHLQFGLTHGGEVLIHAGPVAGAQVLHDALAVFGHRGQHALLHHDSRIGLPVALGRILKSGAEKARVERQRCGFRWEQIGPAEAGIALPGVAAGGRRHRPEANTLADHLGHLLVNRFGLELASPGTALCRCWRPPGLTNAGRWVWSRVGRADR